MSDKKQIINLELQRQNFNKQLTFKNKIFKSILGSRILFNIQSMDNLSLKKQSYNPVISDIQACQKIFNNSQITAVLLCGALALSLRRYFSSLYSKLSFTTIACDLTLLTSGMIFGAIYGVNSSSQKLDIIRTTLIKDKNTQFIHFIGQFSQNYHISYKHISRLIAGSVKQADALLKQIEQKQKQLRSNSTKKHLIL